MTITEIRVHMDCVGCETKIKKALQKLDGVDDIDIDIAMQKVTVMGWAEQKKVLKAVKKTGRRAELWAYPYNPQYYNYQTTQPNTYYATATTQHGYSNHHHRQQQQEYGYYSNSSGIDVQATSLFSDENPHACSIM
ncbi:heavy metal-associated isoprenylated plant protein 28-like [Euphorbia lathyris]|uniref:heavy metal-associated isoprenylated plant protein 28-like n=1 Tax=Euphorbia lathyris TaxID=212925 RepID=UPI003313A68D